MHCHSPSDYVCAFCKQVVAKKKTMNLQTASKTASTTSIVTSSQVGSQDSSGTNLSLGQNNELLATSGTAQMKQYLGNYDPECIPEFPKFQLSSDENRDLDNFVLFESRYKEHCLMVVNAVGELNFAQ